MKSVIVGTAGHIDHGKTSLVKALTGIDTDRLEEEKRRGITIDLGFAHLDLPAPDGEILRLGFVDVPGHERFVRNMLAGVGGIDVLLLVIAADESIKPQTREHFDICRLLSVQRGITVLTKSDLVDLETLDVVRLEVEEFVRGSFLDAAHSPIIPVSARSGAGLEALKDALRDAARSVVPRDSSALARLPIDRVFTMKGFGTVVTGTLVAGSIHKEDELEAFPARRRVRVRGVQVHGSSSEAAVAGQRTALNLAGVTTEELSRGMMLATPGLLASTQRADVELTLLPSAKALKDRARVHLHVFTAETVAEVRLYGEKQVAPGATALVQLRLAEPALLLPGDRFIVRQFSPVVTIGGGSVLHAAAGGRVRRGSVPEFLRKLRNGTPEEILLTRIERYGALGLAMAQAIVETGWRAEFIRQQLAVALREKRVIQAADVFVSAAVLEQLQAALVSCVSEFHEKNPLVAGIGREELRDRSGAAAEVFEAALTVLTREKKLASTGETVHLAGRGVVLQGEEAQSRRTIEQAFASAGLQVPFLKDVLAGLRVDRARAQKIVTLLLRDKVLVKVSDDLVFHGPVLEDLKARVRAQKGMRVAVNVADFKELTGVSRKYAIPLLEYLDRERVTRREGDARVIL